MKRVFFGSDRERERERGRKKLYRKFKHRATINKIQKPSGVFFTLPSSFFLFLTHIFCTQFLTSPEKLKKSKHSDSVCIHFGYNYLVDHNINCMYAIEQQNREWAGEEEIEGKWSGTRNIHWIHIVTIMMAYECIFLDSIIMIFFSVKK